MGPFGRILGYIRDEESMLDQGEQRGCEAARLRAPKGAPARLQRFLECIALLSCRTLQPWLPGPCANLGTTLQGGYLETGYTESTIFVT